MNVYGNFQEAPPINERLLESGRFERPVEEVLIKDE
jgi:hypothetical protein